MGRVPIPALAFVALAFGACSSPGERVAAPSGTDTLVNIAPQSGGPTTATTAAPPLTSVVASAFAPPPDRTEVVAPSPGPEMVWQPGYWSFDGTNWNWVPGSYAPRPQPAARWVPGRWTKAPGGGGVWIWTAGRWVS